MMGIEYLVFALGGVGGFYLVTCFFNQKESASKEKLHQNDRKQDNGSSRQSYASPQRAWYEVLEIAESASFNEIKKAYRDKMKEYHPDRFVHLGKEFAALAEERAKEITQAYHYICNIRKF